MEEIGAYLVAAAVALESCRKGNCRCKEEDHVESVESDQDDGMDGPVYVPRRWEEVEEREPGEGRDEHSVVDRRGVPRERLGDHVTDESHDEQCPDELSCQYVY